MSANSSSYEPNKRWKSKMGRLPRSMVSERFNRRKLSCSAQVHRRRLHQTRKMTMMMHGIQVRRQSNERHENKLSVKWIKWTGYCLYRTTRRVVKRTQLQLLRDRRIKQGSQLQRLISTAPFDDMIRFKRKAYDLIIIF